MREILFRGKSLYKKWLEGYVTHIPCAELPNSNWFITDGKISLDSSLNECRALTPIHTIFPETLGQFSGVLDSNGEKIFEGDILKMTYAGKYLGGVNGIAEVVFQNGKFGVLWGFRKELVCLDGFANTKIEVVGNVFDNPELLEENDGT